MGENVVVPWQQFQSTALPSGAKDICDVMAYFTLCGSSYPYLVTGATMDTSDVRKSKDWVVEFFYGIQLSPEAAAAEEGLNSGIVHPGMIVSDEHYFGVTRFLL